MTNFSYFYLLLGIIHTADSEYAHHHQPEDIQEMKDDAQTKFYKSRFKRSTVADSTGRTPIYDFDEWSRQHYGKAFERRQEAKSKFDRQEAQKHIQRMSVQNEIIIFGLIFCVAATYMIFVAESSLDTPQKAADPRTPAIPTENSRKM